MHMHCHIRSCIEDYGPSHGFWLFAFERYNGILGSVPNNNRCIELQLMKRFVADGLLKRAPLPSEYTEEHGCHFTCPEQSKPVGSLADTILPHSSLSGQPAAEWTLTADIILPSHRSRPANQKPRLHGAFKPVPDPVYIEADTCKRANSV